MATEYSQKLKHPKWQRRRLEILQRDNFTCMFCNDSETELQIHHKKYVNGRQIWEYEDVELITLCKHCHSVVEYLKRNSERTEVSSSLKLYRGVDKKSCVIITKSTTGGVAFFEYINDSALRVMSIGEVGITKLKSFL